MPPNTPTRTPISAADDKPAVVPEVAAAGVGEEEIDGDVPITGDWEGMGDEREDEDDDDVMDAPPVRETT